MAEKQGVIILYKYEELLERLPLEDQGRILQAALKYDRTGEAPSIENPVADMLFSLMKTDIDQLRNSWERRVIANQGNGKKGGRPKKNPTKAKEPSGLIETPEKPMGFSENPTKAKEPDIDIDNGIDNDYEFGSGDIITVSETKKPPPLIFIKKIKEEAVRLGYNLDTGLTQKMFDFITKFDIPFQWLEGPFNFAIFADGWIKTNDKYAKKKPQELNLIFASSFGWENLHNAYPSWCENQKREVAEKTRRKAKQEALEKAKADKPTECPKCRKPLPDDLQCRDCQGGIVFSDVDFKYIFHEWPTGYHPDKPFDFAAILRANKLKAEWSG
jgi:hypothetical protein